MHRHFVRFFAPVLALVALASGTLSAEPAPVLDGAPRPANAGINMAYYRNFFSGSMNHLLQLVADKVEPSGAVVLPSLEARDWWTQTRTTELSRLYALHLHGFIVPEADGDYRFFADVRGQMRFFLSPGADEARAVPLPFAPAPAATNGQDAAAPVFNLVSPPVVLRAGRRYFVRVLFIPGWQERLKILWAHQTDDGVQATPEPITSAHLRTSAE